MKINASSYSLRISVIALLLLPVSLLADSGVSHVRVVRMSYTGGTVAIKRAPASGWAKAMVNTPIEEGFAISTSADSFAEVEFENGSTARLGELSRLDFSQLAMDSDGNKVNRLVFDQGYATFHFVPDHKDVYAVQVGGVTITPNGKSEFRTNFDHDDLRVAVFSGSVGVVGPARSVKLGRDKVLECNTQAPEQAFNIQNGSSKDAWDKWVDARDSQSQLALKSQAVSARGPRYGWSDLGAYGEWADIPGFGYGWAPYAPMGWAPYSMGMWNWYPSFGWTWISGEPWGWLPYHYGAWNFAPSFGWFWMPGNMGGWSPARVNWFAGPGWIGWAPYGYGLRRGINSVTAVAEGTVQNSQLVNSRNVLPVIPGQATLVRQPAFSPAASTMLSGVPLGPNVLLPGSKATERAPDIQASGNSKASLTGGTHVPITGAKVESAMTARPVSAPATVLMGGNPTMEKAFLDSRQNSLGRAFTGSRAQPLQVRHGTTLGGQFAVGGQAGEFGAGSFSSIRDNPRAGAANAPRTSASSPGPSRAAPSVLPRAGSAPAGGMTRSGGAGDARGGGISSGSPSHAGSGLPNSGTKPSGGRR